MTLDLSHDYQRFDGTEMVTHTSKRAGGDLTDTVPYALPQPLRVQEAPGRWALSSTDKIWTLPAAEMAYDPVPGDTLTDAAGRVWTIRQAVKDNLTGQWHCDCLRER